MSKASGGSGARPLAVVMGVAGSGKTTIGEAIAARLGVPFIDADWLHTPANVEKMRAGIALEDADRWPWLRDVAARIDAARREGTGCVVACSALKRAYRDVLIGGRRDVRLVYLQGDAATIEPRLASRTDHYMPSALLASQFAALEEPQADEHPIVVPIEPAPVEIVETILPRLA